MKHALHLAAIFALVSLGLLFLSLRADSVAAPQMGATFQAAAFARIDALEATVHGLPAAVLPPVLAELHQQATRITNTADARLAAIESDVANLGMGLSAIADSRLGEATAQLKTAAGAVTQLQLDLSPVLRNAAALSRDAQDSLDDLYPDVKASVESATVAITSAAQTSEAIRAAAPELAKSAVKFADSSVGIAADAKREADELTKPKKLYEKLLGPTYMVARIFGIFF